MTSSISSSSRSSSMNSSLSFSSSSSSSTNINASLSSSITSTALEQIAQLSNPPQETAPFSKDPKIFFACFDINTCLFTEKDVELLHDLFRKTKFNPNLCLMDLLGLQFYRLLTQLTSSWPQPTQSKQIKEWASFYLFGYLGLLRQSVEEEFPKSDTTEKFRLDAKTLMQKLREFKETLVQTEEQQFAGSKKSAKAHLFLKAKTKPIWEEWNALQKFLEKCLVQKEPRKILCDRTLAGCSGSEWMLPQSENEVFQVLQNLCLYLEMISKAEEACLEKKWIGVDGSFFKNLLNKTAALSRLKKPNEIVNHSKQLLNFISQEIVKLQENLQIARYDLIEASQGELSHHSWCQARGIKQGKAKNSDEFLETIMQIKNQLALKSCWLSDCEKILEESIINPLDPSFYISWAYVTRIQLNLEPIFADLPHALVNQFRPSLLPRDLAIEEQLQDIKLKFFVFLEAEGNLPTIRRLPNLLEGSYGTLLLKDKKTSLLLISLKKQLHVVLDELYALDLKTYKKQDLSQQLLWLSRMFVLLHDLTFLSKPACECSELEIFPDKFLQLLIPEEPPENSIISDPNLAASPFQNELDAEVFSSSLPLQPPETKPTNSSSSNSEPFNLPAIKEMPLEASPIHLESEAVKSVQQTKKAESQPQISSKALKKKGKKEEKKPLAPPPKSSLKKPAQTINPEPLFPEVTPRDLLQIRKRRDVEAILTTLGLKPIRTKGDHTIWKNPNDARIQTVVPHHSEIKQGTRSAMVKQITPQE